MGSSENQWSGPSKSCDNVKCFSKKHAPNVHASDDAKKPWVWSEKPNGIFGNIFESVSNFRKFTSSRGVGYSEVVTSMIVG